MKYISSKELKNVLTNHQLWLNDKEGGVQANLSGVNLGGVDLSWVELSGANLSGADLSGANLFGADLSGANLSGANLRWANLKAANLYQANFSKADLFGANLSNIITDAKHLKHISGYPYSISIFNDIIRVECKTYTYKQWMEFSDKEIEAMDGKKALKFYPIFKTLLTEEYKDEKN